MAAEEADKGGGAEGGPAAAPPKAKLSPQLLLVLGNTVLMLAALGVLAYTKLMYQRPVIQESEEMQKKQDELKTAPEPVEKPIVRFDQMMVNIAITSGKQHYATLAFAVECRDEAASEAVNKKKALFIDKVLHSLGRRQITELNTIQGKLLLKTELIREFNSLIAPGAVTDLYFATFILQ